MQIQDLVKRKFLLLNQEEQRQLIYEIRLRRAQRPIVVKKEPPIKKDKTLSKLVQSLSIEQLDVFMKHILKK